MLSGVPTPVARPDYSGCNVAFAGYMHLQLIASVSGDAGRTRRVAATASPLADWHLLLDEARPNGVIVGTTEMVGALLSVLIGRVAQPVFHAPRDGMPWACPGRFKTLVIHNLGALGADDQRRLAAWIEGVGRRVQVIAIASPLIYALVERGQFSERLYYRLNHVYLDTSGNG